MERLPVSSSMMVAVGYAVTRRTLEIEFRGGDVYQYFRVPPEVFRALLDAPSKGRFFHAHLDGVFDFVRVRARRDRRASSRPARP